MPEIEAKLPRRVAVLGVHGIARHPPGETMTAMADLLLSLPSYEGKHRCGPGEYKAFKAVGIDIPLQPVCVKDRVPVVSEKKTKFSLEEESAKFAAYLKPKSETKAERKIESNRRGEQANEGGTDTGNQYTRLLLESYAGGADSNIYSTTRLEGERKESPGRPSAKVDIYEVLWADLAHPESSVVGFFLSLFTLLFHLGSLSRLTVDSGAAEQDGPLWSAYLGAQRWAVRMLQIFLPLLKVLLLVTIFAAIPGVSQMINTNWGFAAGLGLLGGAGVGFLVFRSTRWIFGRSPWVWALVVLLPGLLGAAGIFGLARWADLRVVGSLECWVFVGIPLLGFILNQYESYRNGVQFVGWTGYIVCLAGFVLLLPKSHWNVPLASFWLVEFVVAAIRASWLAMCALAAVAMVLGWLLCRLEKIPGKKARLSAAVRTSRFALAMPAAFFLLVTPLIWAALFKIAKAISQPYFHLTKIDNVDVQAATDWLVMWNFIPCIASDGVRKDYLHTLMGWAMGYQLPITLVLIGSAFFLLLWWALPSALLERFPQRGKATPPRSSTNAQTLHLGTWLSRGLDGTAAVTALFWCSIFLAFPAVYLLGLYHSDWRYASEIAKGIEWLRGNTELIVHGVFLGVGFATLVAIVKYGSSVLETILDVDTYLRTSPEDATPRAKIFERFVSTLRYVAQYKDEDGNGYDSVVIVAHSLGSLISADILRFLYAQQSDPQLAQFGFGAGPEYGTIRLRLLTMGSPIRQLLNRFFPYLYDWVRPEPDNGLAPLPAASTAAPANVAFPNTPDPSQLGLELWVNAYRSGDYVGRSLWLDEWYLRTDPRLPRHDPKWKDGRYPEPIYKWQVSGTAYEMCIGAGAHTHYWDDTAPDVADVLDGMI